MEQFVINIGRQLGSGGKDIGEIIARRLGIREGGSVRLAFTAVGPTLWVIELKEVIL